MRHQQPGAALLRRPAALGVLRGAALRQHQAARAGAGGAEPRAAVQQPHHGRRALVQSALTAGVRARQALRLPPPEGRHGAARGAAADGRPQGPNLPPSRGGGAAEVRARRYGARPRPRPAAEQRRPGCRRGTGPAEVLIKVHACGVNPVETYIRSGNYARKPALPYTPGSDVSGVIESVGEHVTAFKIMQLLQLIESFLCRINWTSNKEQQLEYPTSLLIVLFSKKAMPKQGKVF